MRIRDRQGTGAMIRQSTTYNLTQGNSAAWRIFDLAAVFGTPKEKQRRQKPSGAPIIAKSRGLPVS
jgi:hypothetical protein